MQLKTPSEREGIQASCVYPVQGEEAQEAIEANRLEHDVKRPSMDSIHLCDTVGESDATKMILGNVPSSLQPTWEV
jgi:hypothetical protein